MTQQELAAASGVSISLIGKLESGDRESTRWATMLKLARALDVDPGRLAGKRPQLQRVAGGSILQVRDAVLSPSLLPGSAEDSDGEPSTPAELMSLVERAYGAYFAGEFGALAADVPTLLAECRTTANAVGEAAVAAPMAHAWQIAACLLVHTGRDDAAAVAAERAIRACAAGDDPARLATMYGTYSWVLLHQGRTTEAEALAVKAADEVEPVRQSTPRQRTAWGGLILHAAVAAGSRNDASAASEYLRLAKGGAVRLGENRHDYWVSYGPTHVAVQETHIMTALGKPDAALTASRHVHREHLLPVQWGRHRLNDARSLLERRRTDEAIDAAAEARALSPEWFRHQGFARSLVADLVDRKTRLSSTMRDLVRGIDLLN